MNRLLVIGALSSVLLLPRCALAVTRNPSPTLSLTPTTSPTASVSGQPQPTSAINLDEIQKIREAVQQKVKEKLNQIVNVSATKKAWVGSITALSEGTITLSSRNLSRTVTYDDSTTFVDVNRIKTNFNKLKVGQTLIAMGYPDSDTSLPAKRIVLTSSTDMPDQKTIVTGKITDISSSSSTLVIISSSNKDMQYEVTVNDKTQLSDLQKTKLVFKNLKLSQKVLAVLNPNANKNSYTATALFVIGN